MDNSGFSPNEAYGKRYAIEPWVANEHALLMQREQVYSPARMENAGGGALEAPAWITFARANRVPMLLGGIAGALVALAITLPQPRVYRARASMELLPVNENFLNINNVNPMAQSATDLELQTQVRIIQSRPIVDKAVNRLRNSLETQPVSENAAASFVRKLRGTAAPNAATLRDRAVEMARQTLKAHPLDKTRIIEISCESTSPEAAAEFLNGLSMTFAEQNLADRGSMVNKAGNNLKKELAELRTKLQTSEAQLQRYTGTSGLLITSDKRNVVEQRLEQLQTELAHAQVDRVAKESRYKMALSSSADALPDVLDNSLLRSHELKIADLRRQAAELSATLTPANPKVMKIEAQIKSLEAAVESERANVVARIRNEFDDASRREAMLSAAFKKQIGAVQEQAGKGVYYDVLKREAESDRQLYEAMLQKVKETGVAAAVRQSNVQVVEPATPPNIPIKPDPYRATGIGLFFGLCSGALLGFVRSGSSHQIQHPGETSILLGIPELGAVISVDADPAIRTRTRESSKSLSLLNGERADGDLRSTDPLGEERGTLVAESFRSAVASILFFRQHNRVLVIASPMPEEGKTTIVGNLGRTLAAMKQRVVLIDGDLRRPALHEVLGLPNEKGLSAYLSDPSDEYPIDNLVVPTATPGLHFIPAGCGQQEVDQLYSEKINRLLRRLRRDFDVVLIDTPAMLHLSDARMLARSADGVILVVRAGRTARQAILTAMQKLTADGTPVLGSILNDWQPKRGSLGYYDPKSFYKYYRARGTGSGA